MVQAQTGNRQPRKQDDSKIVMDGVIKDTLPNAFFTVQLDGGHKVLAHLGGKMRKNYIRVGVGDRVQVELSPYDLTRGRITWRVRHRLIPLLRRHLRVPQPALPPAALRATRACASPTSTARHRPRAPRRPPGDAGR